MQLIAGDGKLITGGASQNLCLWSVGGVANVRNAEDHEKYVLDFCVVAVVDTNF